MRPTQVLTDLCLNPLHTRWMGPLLLMGDALLCALIISEISCKLGPRSRPSFANRPIPRHRDRLDHIHAASIPLPQRRTRLHATQGLHGPSRLSRSARVHILDPVRLDSRWPGYPIGAGHLCRAVLDYSGGRNLLLPEMPRSPVPVPAVGAVQEAA